MYFVIVTIVALAAGYAIGVLRTQRAAISAQAQLKAEQQHAEEAMRKQAPVATNGIMLCLQYGKDERVMTQGLFFTTLMSVVTIPLVAYVASLF